MDTYKFTSVIKRYKKCPNCGSSYKDTKLKVSLENEIITISCECGFFKQVDENNKKLQELINKLK